MPTGITKYAASALALALAASSSMAEDSGAITTKTGQIGAPAAGKAQIVFFRPGTIIGVALGCTVH